MSNNRDRARVRGLVTYHASEVDPMLNRLATVHPEERISDALAAVFASGVRFSFTSELETALLAHLGYRPDTTSRDANTRRRRRESGRACPACYDSGWTVDDDLMATRCECAPPIAHERDHHEDTDTGWADESTAYDAMRHAREALRPEVNP